MKNEMRYAVNIVNFDDERDITTVAMFYDKWSCTKFIAATIEANNNARNDMDGLQLVQEFVLFQNETNKAIQDAWTWDLVEQEDIAGMVEDRLRDAVQFRRLNK